MSRRDGQDPYLVLGVRRGIDEDGLRQAWREAARRHHPDTGGDAEKFKQSQWAFEAILEDIGKSDINTRGRSADGDEEKSGDNNEGAGFEVEHDGHIGERVMVEVMVEHSTAVFGGTARTTRWRMIHCPACGGAGATCIQCTGDGRIGAYHTSIINIPPRTAHGDIIGLYGEGDAGKRRRDGVGRGTSNAGPYGELQVRVLVAREPWIVETGDDLRTETSIGVYDALLGGEVAVRGLDGTYSLTVPSGVQPGQQLRIVGRGRPKDGGGRGDLVVVVHVEIPQQLGAYESRILGELRRDRTMRGGR